MYRRAILAMIAVVFACACQRRDAGAPASRIATVGDQVISAADFKARAAEQSFDVARYRSLDRKKELLDGIVRSELLVQEARRRHLDDDPDVRSAIERVLIQKLARVFADEAAKQSPLPEAEARRYYDQHKTEFVTPTRVRVARLFLAAPENAPKRERAIAEATRLLKEAKAKDAKGDKQAPELLASQQSEDAASKTTGGDLGFRTKDELAAAWGSELADAALSLKAANEIGPVVATQKGVHLIRLLGRHEGYETSYEAAKSRIEGRLATERRSRSIDDLVAELKKKTKVDIDEKALSAVEISPAESRAPAAPPRSQPTLGLR